MRVLTLTTSFPGGTGDPAGGFVEELASALRPLGIDSDIELLRAGPGGALATWERGSAWRRARLVADTLRLLARSSRRADLILAHWLVPCGLPALWDRRPVVGVAHGGDVRILARHPGLAGLVPRLAGVIAVSDAIARELTHPRTLVTPMGVAPTSGAVRIARRPDQPLRLTFVGRLVPIKGLATLLEATRQLPEVRLTVVGDGPERSLAARAPHARFLGALTPSEVRSVLAATDLLCVPSVGAEGMPRVVFEAAALGVPCLASRVGGLPEHVPPGGLVTPGDVTAWQGAIRAAARQLPRTAQVPTWPAVAQKVAVFLNTCLTRPPPCAASGPVRS